MVASTNLITQAVINRKDNVLSPNKDTKNSTQKVDNEPKRNDLVSKEVSAAAKAYTSAQITTNRMPTVDEYKNNLLKNGKIEDKDFKVKKQDNQTYIIEYNDKNQEKKVTLWANIDGSTVYSGSEEFSYRQDGKKLYSDTKNGLGKLESHTHYYYNDEINQDIISHDGLRYDTKIDEYLKNLKDNNIKYTQQDEVDKFGNLNKIVEEYDADNKQTTKTVWMKANDNSAEFIYRELYNNEGKTIVNIYYDNEKTCVTNYFNKN